MSIDKARAYLREIGLGDRIMEFEVSSATVSEAAAAIGCKEAEIAKTLSFIVDDRPILIVAAGDGKVANPKFKAQFHTKAKMIPFDQVEALIGHAVGGVCPFGVNEGVTVYLDTSLRRFEVIYPACGSSSSAVRLTPDELDQATGHPLWIDVCRDAE